jgi:hypothetical protein
LAFTLLALVLGDTTLVDGGGVAADGTSVPSGPFTETLGISDFDGVAECPAPVGEVEFGFRAPGGT